MDGKQNPILSGESPQSVSPNTPNLNNIYPNPNEEKSVLNQGYQQSSIETDNKTQSGGNKKLLAIVIAGVVILVGIVAIFFVPKLLGPGKNEMKSTLDSIDSVLPNAISACKEVRDEAYSYNLKTDLYEMEVNSCRESVATLFGLIDEFDSAGNAEIQKAFDAFKASLDVNMPNPSQLENTLKTYTAMHDFNYVLRDFQTDGKSLDSKTEKGEKLIETANHFTNSRDDELVQFGNEVKQLYSEMHDAWYQFRNEINEMGENSQTNLDKYVNAEKAFNSYVQDNIPNITSSYPLANDENGEISNAFKNLMNKI